ncbi:SH3 domain-containing protein [Microbacterium terrisoli]|uniref:SH3 domain-containing protein n=1 Tax=Microbacterium terrisoli TaxID=3242192 RepID=UPI0028047FB6|nr:SH3 domain-containing protein [Microbacterium protaetiae]
MRSLRTSARLRWFAALLAACLAAAVLALVAPAQRADAAELPASIIDGGYIISDAEFYNSGSMTEAQIQAFIEDHAHSCASGATCLSTYRGDLTSKAKDSYCAGAPAQKGVTAARMIYVAANSCKINPKVILVMLQKEQGLVTSSKPSDWNFEHAMGQACPDTPAGCSAASAGFWNQVYLGARQMQIYTKYPSSFGYRAGQVNTIKWAPSSSCGTSKVLIKNQATANLYNYTPYRPNIAALAAGWGTGDACSTYGNRNFYNYYVAWFGGGLPASSGAPAQIAACTVPASGDISARDQAATVAVQELNARKAPTTLCGSGVYTLAKGAKVTITGVYGAWSRVKTSTATSWVTSSYLATDAVTAPPSSTTPPPTSVCAQPKTVTAASGTVVVTVANLNARTAPSTSCSTGVKTITKGQKFTRTGTSGNWWRLNVGGVQRWASSDYLSLQAAAPAPAPAPVATTAWATVGLNLRSSASLSAKILTVIPRGGKVTVVKKSGSWSEVKYGTRTGWVANAYLTTSAPKSTTTTTTTRKTTAALNLRSSASLSAKILTVIPRGGTVTVLKTSGSWSQVKYGTRTGWVANAYLTTSTRTSTSPTTTTRKATAALNLRSSASLSARVLAVIPRGGTVTVLKTSGSWSQVKYGTRTGWSANAYLR